MVYFLWRNGPCRMFSTQLVGGVRYSAFPIHESGSMATTQTTAAGHAGSGVPAPVISVQHVVTPFETGLVHPTSYQLSGDYFAFTSQNRSTHTDCTLSGFPGGAAHR